MEKHGMNYEGVEVSAGQSLLIKMGPRRDYSLLVSYSKDGKHCFLTTPFGEDPKVFEISKTGTMKKTSVRRRTRIVGH